MEANESSKIAPAKAGQEARRLINRTKMANIHRRVQGALKRIDRHMKELIEVRSILRRRFVERTDAKGNTIQIRLRPFEVATYRNKRAEIEKELVLARRDHMIADREYRDVIKNNFQVNSYKLKTERKKNSLRRKSNNLLMETIELFNNVVQNGGAEEVEEIQNLALAGDVRGVRAKFNELVSRFAPEHYVTLSGVSSVKTEVIHGVMEELAKQKQEGNPGNLSDAVSPDEGGAQ